MKEYTTPIIELTTLGSSDIISTSGDDKPDTPFGDLEDW